MPEWNIRPARTSDAAPLTDLMRRSKAHWGYDEAFIRKAWGDLCVHKEAIDADWIRILMLDDSIAGFVHCKSTPDPMVVWLENLFVDPVYIRQGYGRVLWDQAVVYGQSLQATHLQFEADPNAEAFYHYLGAETIGAAASTLFPGRSLPLMQFTIPTKQE